MPADMYSATSATSVAVYVIYLVTYLACAHLYSVCSSKEHCTHEHAKILLIGLYLHTVKCTYMWSLWLRVYNNNIVVC